MGNWETIDKRSKLLPGVQYRAVWIVPMRQSKKNFQTVINTIKGADKFMHSLPKVLQLGYANLNLINIITPSVINPNAKSWPVMINFRVKNPSDNQSRSQSLTVGDTEDLFGFDDAGELLALAALIGAAALAITVTLHSLERLIAPIFNPGTLVIIAITLITIFGGLRRGRVPV